MKKSQPFLLMALLCLLLNFLPFTNVLVGMTVADCDDQLLFASSNTSGMIANFDVSDNTMITSNPFASTANDADGIYYNSATDKLYQLNRTNNTISEYSNVMASLNNGMMPSVSATSSANDFSNGREIAVFGNKLVVAQDGNTANNDENKLVVFTIGNGTITLDKVFDVSFNLWGIHLNGNTLLAIEDNSNNLAVFNDFFSNAAGAISPTMMVAVDGLIRTHGLTYEAAEDYLILTDIGDAMNANDGALVAVPNFMAAMADGTITASEQIRVSGAASQLGNPVDVAYNSNDGRIYVAERATSGGLILGFQKPVLSGGVKPFYSVEFAGASAIYFSCADGSNPCEFVDGGTVELANGGTETTIFVDGNPDMISFNSSVMTSPDYDFTYVVTDANGMILGIPPGNMVDFDGAGLGVCNVYGLTYTGNLNIMQGDDLFASNLAISDACFDLSSNSLSVNRVTPQSAVANVFASSNNSGVVGVVGILADGNTIMNMFSSQGMDADGIYYDEGNDVLYQLNRSANVVNAYSGVSVALANGTMPTLSATSTSDFTNGREIAVVGNKLIVAQDGNTANGDVNRLYVYTLGNNTITLDKTFDVNINLWGIHLDGARLYAIQDNSNNLAVYDNIFGNASGSIVPTQLIAVENLVRTHGLTYNSDEDLMILTDIGEASSATDGFLIVVQNFSSKIGDDMISASEQIKVGGANSQLGNPVDVAYDAMGKMIYVAERASNGGMILGFNVPVASGGVAPTFTKGFAGASAVNIVGPEGDACNFVDGGIVELTTGGTQATIFVDGNPDMLSFNSTVPASSNYTFTYVVKDANGMILGIPPGNTVDFDGAGLGVCNVYGLTYTGNLNIMQGDDLFASGLAISDACFDLSSNNISVTRVNPQNTVGNVFASSNNSGNVGVIGLLPDGNATMSMFASQGMDADGIYYDEGNDVLYQLNRSANVVNAYSGVSMALANGTMPTLSATSTSDFTNGREIAVAGDKLIVAQDGNTANGDVNRLYVYTLGNNTITLDKTFDVDINLWGIHLDGGRLYAIQDNSNNLAVYENILGNAAGSIVPTQLIAVENLVRTHGLTYNSDEDLMILTDIGEASSATDGFLIVVQNFSSKIGDDMISASEQIRVGGGNSQLGNPVDVAYDAMGKMIYVAERASNGGMILGFNMPVLSGGVAPSYTKVFAGASAVNIVGPEGDACNIVDGGMVELTTGGTQATIFVDGNPDMLSFNSTVPAATNYTFTYVVTDADGLILGIPPGNTVDFDGAGLGVCNVYGLTYTGNLNIMQGDDLFAPNLAISDACFDLSNNNISVTRVMPQAVATTVFASSNNSGNIGIIGVLPDGNATMSMFASQGMDADGILYNEETDRLYQLNRSANVIDVYGDVSAALANGTMPTLITSSTSDFTNGREIAVSGNKLVVAQDAAASNNSTNALVIYEIGLNSITLEKTYNVNFNLWGIHLDGSTLYAIQDNSDNVAVFLDFFNNPAGTVDPTQVVFVQNMVRTHGLTYIADEDLMILTDIGEASSANDGFLVVIPKFTAAASDNTIEFTEQKRVGGGSSQLGNPVDVAYDDMEKVIYVAERAKNGGMILGFNMPALSGGIAPIFAKPFAGASAVNISGSQGGSLCELIQGGMVSFANGGTETTIFVDGTPDMLSFSSTVPSSMEYNFTYVVTDANGMILGIPPGNMVDFDGAGLGVCNVYGLTYTGNLNIMQGDDLFANGLAISDDCFDLSSNNLSVNRIAPQATSSDIFASSNTTGTVGVLGILDESSATMNMFAAQGMDADGVHYDDANDMLYQLNRSANVIDVYSNVKANLANNNAPTYITSSTSDFTNGREMVVLGGDKLVVAQDGNPANGDQNRLIVYDIAGGGISLMSSHDVNINLWGIENVGDDLYAIVDNSNQLAIFQNFLSTAGTTATPDQIITVDGLVRTHGLTYNAASDYMVLTDIGAASSAGDGALVGIKNFSTASADDNISASEQVRVSGGGSQLGNPVDVEYDSSTGLIYVAERANGGGKILGFRMPALSGGIAPVYVKAFAGASAIYLNNPNANMLTDPNQNVNALLQGQNVNVVLAELYPIPASTDLNAVLEVDIATTTTINIFAINGTLVKSFNVDLIEGRNTLEMDISNLQSGSFFLNIPELGKTIQFVKL